MPFQTVRDLIQREIESALQSSRYDERDAKAAGVTEYAANAVERLFGPVEVKQECHSVAKLAQDANTSEHAVWAYLQSLDMKRGREDELFSLAGLVHRAITRYAQTPAPAQPRELPYVSVLDIANAAGVRAFTLREWLRRLGFTELTSADPNARVFATKALALAFKVNHAPQVVPSTADEKLKQDCASLAHAIVSATIDGAVRGELDEALFKFAKAIQK